MPKIKVRVVLSLEVDTEAWGMAYGIDEPAEVRRDVVEYAADQVRGSAAGSGEGGIVSVTVK
jgi:hypothetical protein